MSSDTNPNNNNDKKLPSKRDSGSDSKTNQDSSTTRMKKPSVGLLEAMVPHDDPDDAEKGLRYAPTIVPLPPARVSSAEGYSAGKEADSETEIDADEFIYDVGKPAAKHKPQLVPAGPRPRQVPSAVSPTSNSVAEQSQVHPGAVHVPGSRQPRVNEDLSMTDQDNSASPLLAPDPLVLAHVVDEDAENRLRDNHMRVLQELHELRQYRAMVDNAMVASVVVQEFESAESQDIELGNEELAMDIGDEELAVQSGVEEHVADIDNSQDHNIAVGEDQLDGQNKSYLNRKCFLMIAAAAVLLIAAVLVVVFLVIGKDDDNSDSSSAPETLGTPVNDKQIQNLKLTLTGVSLLSSMARNVWETVTSEHSTDAYNVNDSMLRISDVTTTYTFKDQSYDGALAQLSRLSNKDGELSTLTILSDQTVSYLDLGLTLNELELAQYPFQTEALRDTYLQKLRERDPATFASVTSVSMVQTPAATSEPTPSLTPEFTPSPTPEPTPSPTPELTPGPTLPPEIPQPDNATPEPTSGPLPEPTPNPTAAPLLEGTWTQLGGDLLGEVNEDWFGQSVAMSANGNIVAVGAPQNDGENRTYDDSGSVYVHVWNETSETWNQLGGVLRGDNEGDRFGTSVALSTDATDGLTLAVGAPGSGYVRISRLMNDVWITAFDLPGDGGAFGSSVALSANGSTLAIGASGSGQVSVFRLESNSWSPIGPSNYAGRSVALSEDGSMLAVGGVGFVRVFQILDNSLSLVGSELNGDPSDRFGDSVALSGDGAWLAVGALNYDGSAGQNNTLVRVFRLNNTEWSQVGSDLEGEDEYHRFGSSVALSTNGTILAVGATGLSNRGHRYPGYVHVYQSLVGEWGPVGSPITGNATQDLFGSSVALSSDGRTVVGGARQRVRPGYASVYRLQEEKDVQEQAQVGPGGM